MKNRARLSGALAFVTIAAMCSVAVDAAEKTKSATCSAYDSDKLETQYSVQIAVVGGAFELQIQVFHPDTGASRIETVTLSNGRSSEVEFLGEDCICGMEINGVEAGCAHIARYVASLERDELMNAKDDGLGMTFHLANGASVDGPRIAAKEVRRVLD